MRPLVWLELARYFLSFTCQESCGKCTPCREGTTRLLEILERIVEGKGEEGDLKRLESLSQNIIDTSFAVWDNRRPIGFGCFKIFSAGV